MKTRYFDYLLNAAWTPKEILGDWVHGASWEPNSPLGQRIVAFAVSGSNEVDAYLLGVYADGTPEIATDMPWRTFAPFWVRDEAKHAEAFFRLLVALGEAQSGDWFDVLHGEHRRLHDYRCAIYESFPAFVDPLHFWCALALDEWNTSREIAAFARLLREHLGDPPADMIKRVAADEAQHYEYAVSALIAHGVDEASRDATVKALDTVLAWALNMPASTDRFMFDHEPIEGAEFDPSYERATAAVIARLTRAWER